MRRFHMHTIRNHWPILPGGDFLFLVDECAANRGGSCRGRLASQDRR